LLWALVILLIREPPRRQSDSTAEAGATSGRLGKAIWLRAAPIYLVVAMASLVDNAVGAWSPSLFIRSFAKDPAQVGMQLGLLLTAGFGAGVLIGGWLADRAGVRGGWSAKLGICLACGLLLVPESLLINASEFAVALYSIPLYFALSGAVTACGFSAILDIVPNTRRGLAMAVSFFLNVALGGGLGPPAVTFASQHVFGEAAGLGPAIALTVGGCYALVALICTFTLLSQRRRNHLVAI
ncbi:MAG TPA: MFS transporter, partial [Steroidobacteraceae bacterium]|nr:MFS transporter [Steroidobacteraceae bacterium]